MRSPTSWRPCWRSSARQSLVVLAALGGDPWKVVSVSIYGLTLVLLYTFSVLYHSLRGRAKGILQKLDHQSIYLLIAGSYTPFCLVTLARWSGGGRCSAWSGGSL